MGKLPIVDENDNLVEYKERDKINYQEDIYRVSALWIVNSKGELLLAKRAATKTQDPNRWGPAVAGTVDKGESYEQNIIKEAEEELGLTGIEFQKGPKTRVKGRYNYFCQWFILKTDKDINELRIEKDEVSEIKWWTKEELKEQLKANPELFVSSMKQHINAMVE
ncbi:NUDIX domain-containing protein [Candidatus Woesearchaeota archaeon]|nr:NUDIX domain-containing protein [Candidatus Woesearchaeota archaeon]